MNTLITISPVELMSGSPKMTIIRSFPSYETIAVGVLKQLPLQGHTLHQIREILKNR